MSADTTAMKTILTKPVPWRRAVLMPAMLPDAPQTPRQSPTAQWMSACTPKYTRAPALVATLMRRAAADAFRKSNPCTPYEQQHQEGSGAGTEESVIEPD